MTSHTSDPTTQLTQTGKSSDHIFRLRIKENASPQRYQKKVLNFFAAVNHLLHFNAQNLKCLAIMERKCPTGVILISRVNKNNIERSRTIKFHFKMDKIIFGGSTLIHLSMGNSY